MTGIPHDIEGGVLFEQDVVAPITDLVHANHPFWFGEMAFRDNPTGRAHHVVDKPAQVIRGGAGFIAITMFIPGYEAAQQTTETQLETREREADQNIVQQHADVITAVGLSIAALSAVASMAIHKRQYWLYKRFERAHRRVEAIDPEAFDSADQSRIDELKKQALDIGRQPRESTLSKDGRSTIRHPLQPSGGGRRARNKTMSMLFPD